MNSGKLPLALGNEGLSDSLATCSEFTQRVDVEAEESEQGWTEYSMNLLLLFLFLKAVNLFSCFSAPSVFRCLRGESSSDPLVSRGEIVIKNGAESLSGASHIQGIEEEDVTLCRSIPFAHRYC